MEDFVYIILVIAWLVISLMRRRSKNEAQGKARPAPPPETTAQPREVNLEEMLQEFFGSKKEEQPKPEPVREPTAIERSFEKQDKEYSSFDSDFEAMPEPVFEEYTGLDAVNDTYQFSTEVRDQTIEEIIRANAAEEARQMAAAELLEVTADGRELPEFDLRSAIIFSEIINRKYS